MTRTIIFTALLAACAWAGQSYAGEPFAVTTDAKGAQLVLTDIAIPLPDGTICQGAKSFPPEGSDSKPVAGCWKKVGKTIYVTYILADDTLWEEAYPTSEFSLTEYGKALRLQYLAKRSRSAM